MAVRLAAGDLTAAAALAGEAEKVAQATGDSKGLPGALPWLPAWRGEEAEDPSAGRVGCGGAGWTGGRLRADRAALGDCSARATAWAIMTRHWPRPSRPAEDPDELGLATWSLAELIEAAVRTGSPERATEAMRGWRRPPAAPPTDWAREVQARSRALLIEDTSRAAVRRSDPPARPHHGPRRAGPRAPALRRMAAPQGRRRDAREQLRLAYQLLDAMGMAAFAERARRELMAAGEVVAQARDRDGGTSSPRRSLRSPGWPLAGELSNPEIGTQLFISPRTVEWHLRKVFTKLGIGSRKELRGALPDLDRVRWSALGPGVCPQRGHTPAVIWPRLVRDGRRRSRPGRRPEALPVARCGQRRTPGGRTCR